MLPLTRDSQWLLGRSLTVYILAATFLQKYVSRSDRFSLLTPVSEILTIFNQIGTALTQLRIAR